MRTIGGTLHDPSPKIPYFRGSAGHRLVSSGHWPDESEGRTEYSTMTGCFLASFLPSGGPPLGERVSPVLPFRLLNTRAWTGQDDGSTFWPAVGTGGSPSWHRPPPFHNGSREDWIQRSRIIQMHARIEAAEGTFSGAPPLTASAPPAQPGKVYCLPAMPLGRSSRLTIQG